MSRSTRSATVSNVPLHKTDTSTISKNKYISSTELAKSAIIVAPRKLVSSRPADLKGISSKMSTSEVKITRCRSPGAAKHSVDSMTNRGTPSQRAKSSRVLNSVGSKSVRNVIKTEPLCHETVTDTVRNRTTITKANKITDKPSSTVAENTSTDLDVTQIFRPYSTVDDMKRLGYFNPLDFTTACAIDANMFPFACLSCHMVRFKTYEELRLHEDWCGRTLRVDKFYKCRTCERKYHNQAVLNRHESECKQDESQLEKRDSANSFDFSTIFSSDFREFPFFCTSCHIVSFRSLDELRVHENWCGIVLFGLRDSVMCNDCGVSFRNNIVFKGHRKGPPGCPGISVGGQKRRASPLEDADVSGSLKSKRRKLNQHVTTSDVSVAASKAKSKFTVIFCSKRKRISQKSAVSYAKMTKTLSTMKVEMPSIDSPMECSSSHEKRNIQEALSPNTMQKDDSINYLRTSISESQSKNENYAAEDMILESAVSLAANQPCSVPGYQVTEKNTCPICDVVIVGSVDDICLHFRQSHNLAFSADGRYSGQVRSGRTGPTNCLDCDTLFDSRLEMTRHKQVCTKVSPAGTKDSIRFMCAICSTISQNRNEFDTHVETFHGGADEYRQIMLNKIKLINPQPPRESSRPSECTGENSNEQFLASEIKSQIVDEINNSPGVNCAVLRVTVPHRVICGICPAVSESRDKFNTHIQTVHGGADKYQEIMFSMTRSIPVVESSEHSERMSEHMNEPNEEALVNEINPEIVDKQNNSPCVKRAVLRVIVPHRVMCAICPAVLESVNKFDMHIQTVHGGVDKYQEIMYSKSRLYRSTLVESSGSFECISEHTNEQNEQALVHEIKQEIVEETTQSPVVNSAVLGVIIPVKGPTTHRRIVDISPGVEEVPVPQKSLSHVSNEKNNTDLVANKTSQGVENDLVVKRSDIQSCNDGLSQNVPEKSSIAASGLGSSHDAITSDKPKTVKMLRVEDMVASITVNSSLRTKGSEGGVGKIKIDNNPANLQSNPTPKDGKKPFNPQLPVVFNISALQSMFLKNGRRRLRLQTSLVPGSDIVVVGTENITTTKSLTDNNPQTNDKKLIENYSQMNNNKLSKNTEQNNLVNISKSGEKMRQNKLVDIRTKQTSKIDNVPSPSIGDDAGTKQTSEIINVPSPSIVEDEDEEQKKLLLALQLMPSGSVHSPENKDNATIVRKSKRQMAKQVDSVEKTTVAKRAMEMIAAKREISLNTGTRISQLNKEKKAKIYTESESVNTSSGARKTVTVSVTPRLTACSVAIRKLRERSRSIGELTGGEQQNRQTRESCSLADLQERKQSLSGNSVGHTKSSASAETLLSPRSKNDIDGQNAPVILTSTYSVERLTVQSEPLLSDTLLHARKGVLKPVETPSSDLVAQPTEQPVSNQSESKSSAKSELLSPSKKSTRRNLRILEPIDDVSLKCLECGSILCTATEIVSHACPN